MKSHNQAIKKIASSTTALLFCLIQVFPQPLAQASTNYTQTSAGNYIAETPINGGTQQIQVSRVEPSTPEGPLSEASEETATNPDYSIKEEDVSPHPGFHNKHLYHVEKDGERVITFIKEETVAQASASALFHSLSKPDVSRDGKYVVHAHINYCTRTSCSSRQKLEIWSAEGDILHYLDLGKAFTHESDEDDKITEARFTPGSDHQIRVTFESGNTAYYNARTGMEVSVQQRAYVTPNSVAESRDNLDDFMTLLSEKGVSQISRAEVESLIPEGVFNGEFLVSLPGHSSSKVAVAVSGEITIPGVPVRKVSYSKILYKETASSPGVEIRHSELVGSVKLGFTSGDGQLVIQPRNASVTAYDEVGDPALYAAELHASQIVDTIVIESSSIAESHANLDAFMALLSAKGITQISRAEVESLIPEGIFSGTFLVSEQGDRVAVAVTGERTILEASIRKISYTKILYKPVAEEAGVVIESAELTGDIKMAFTAAKELVIRPVHGSAKAYDDEGNITTFSQSVTVAEITEEDMRQAVEVSHGFGDGSVIAHAYTPTTREVNGQVLDGVRVQYTLQTQSDGLKYMIATVIVQNGVIVTIADYKTIADLAEGSVVSDVKSHASDVWEITVTLNSSTVNGTIQNKLLTLQSGTEGLYVSNALSRDHRGWTYRTETFAADGTITSRIDLDYYANGILKSSDDSKYINGVLNSRTIENFDAQGKRIQWWIRYFHSNGQVSVSDDYRYSAGVLYNRVLATFNESGQRLRWLFQYFHSNGQVSVSDDYTYTNGTLSKREYQTWNSAGTSTYHNTWYF